MKKGVSRTKTYIPELDKALSGGIPSGHVNLVTGSAGTMKTSFCWNILYNAAREGKKGVYITLEQTAPSMLDQIESMGYDLEKINLQQIADTTSLFAGIEKLDAKNTDILLIDIANLRRAIGKSSAKHDWFGVIKSLLQKLKLKSLIDLVVVDSLTALYSLSSFKQPRQDLFDAFAVIKDTGCTSFLVSEIRQGSTTYSEYGVEDYLSDGIFLLSTARREMRVLGELSVVKMRSTPISRDVFVIEYKDKAFKVNPYWLNPPIP